MNDLRIPRSMAPLGQQQPSYLKSPERLVCEVKQPFVSKPDGRLDPAISGHQDLTQVSTKPRQDHRVRSGHSTLKSLAGFFRPEAVGQAEKESPALAGLFCSAEFT